MEHVCLAIRALAASLALATPTACDRSPSGRDTPAQTASAPKAPSPSVPIQLPNDAASPVPASADGETVCSERDFPADDRGNRAVVREIYSFPKLNQQLAKYPELALEIGLDQVRSCADARLFGERYRQFEVAHPDFDPSDAPSKADSILR